MLLDDRVFGDEVDTRAARGRVGDGVADVLRPRENWPGGNYALAAAMASALV